MHSTYVASYIANTCMHAHISTYVLIFCPIDGRQVMFP